MRTACCSPRPARRWDGSSQAVGSAPNRRWSARSSAPTPGSSVPPTLHGRISRMVQVRVMTYNIFMGGRRGSALHSVVRASAPDVLVVNEAPKRLFESGRLCRRLSVEWRLRYVAGGRAAGSNMLAVSGLVAGWGAGRGGGGGPPL